MFDRENDDRLERRRFTRRALLVGAAQLAAFGLIGTRLFRLQVLEGDHYVPIAEDNRINVQLLAPLRGRIFDRAGEILASNREAYRAVLVPTLAGNVAEVLARFARSVPLTPDEQQRIVHRARRQPGNVPLVIAADLTFEQIAEINLLSPQLPGIRTEIDSRREYFHPRTVGHVVGFVGAIERHAMDDDPVLRLPGMRIGKAGVEAGLDDVLRGEAGHVKHEVDARGRIVRNLEQVDPIAGNDVVVTLDTTLQQRVLARMSKERRAAIVAMDVTTGEVVAMASRPEFDMGGTPAAPQAQPGKPTGREARRVPRHHDNPLVNRAIRGAYPPGSTFKMVVALAALEAGTVSLRERIECSGRFEYFNHVYRCWKRRGHGPCDLHRALKESCDCYFYEIARRTGIDAIAKMARRFGLGQVYDCGLAHQRAGVVPDPEWKQAKLGRPWLGGETILAAIGQGYVSTTPLQLAVMTARLATGMAVEPRFQCPPPGLRPAKPSPLGIRAEWLKAVQRGLIAVVNEDGGTGGNARIEHAGAKLAGKTGTSQVSRASADKSQDELRWEQRDHALFVGYAPAEAPRYAVVAVVEHAGSGGQAAAPLVREVIEDLLERDPTGKPAYVVQPALRSVPVPPTSQEG